MASSKSLLLLCHFSNVWFFATPWTIAYQTPLSMGFSRQEYWSGLPFPSQVIFPTQGLNSCFLHLLHWQVGSLPPVPPASVKGWPWAHRDVQEESGPPTKGSSAGPGWGHRLVVSINLQGQPWDYWHSSSLWSWPPPLRCSKPHQFLLLCEVSMFRRTLSQTWTPSSSVSPVTWS